MKVHKLTVMIIDHDELGAESASEELECGRFGNRCISPIVVSSETRDIGEWCDSSPLNDHRQIDEFNRLFGIEKRDG